MSLARVRQRCFVTIAQDPCFLHEASLRFNLDPSGSLSTSELVRILDRVGLWSHLLLGTCHSGAAETSGATNDNDSKKIDHDSRGNMSEDEQTPLLSSTDTTNTQLPRYSSNHATAAAAEQILNRSFSSIPTLSGGQSQLLALARGLAQCQCWCHRQEKHQSTTDTGTACAPNETGPSQKQWKPIVLLDEVTSSLDATTEQAVYEIVEEEFVARGHTVVMVTHRIRPFLDVWRRSRGETGTGLTVIWMKDGQVDWVERDVTENELRG